MSLLDSGSVRISAKTDYAIRALVEIAVQGRSDHAVTAETIAAAQAIPVRFLLNILAELRRAALVDSRRGPEGGWWLARPADQITVADAVRAVDGQLTHIATVDADSAGVSTALSISDVWLAVRTSVREVLENTTLADLVAGDRPWPAATSGRQDGDGQQDGVVQEVGDDRAQ
jgi:Rrf2 family protein